MCVYICVCVCVCVCVCARAGTMESFSPLIAALADAIVASASTVGCDVLQL